MLSPAGSPFKGSAAADGILHPIVREGSAECGRSEFRAKIFAAAAANSGAFWMVSRARIRLF
jgi:hypothetical protein